MGLALVTNPRVLFLDEPTSGLDSFTANEVRLCCRKKQLTQLCPLPLPISNALQKLCGSV